jgi:hypothetical protein
MTSLAPPGIADAYMLHHVMGHDRSPSSGMFNEASPQPSMLPRSKQTINELLDESGKLLDIIKTGLPLADEWRASITSQNPERICLDLDSIAFQDKISKLAAKLIAAHSAISNIYEQNRIDQVEFNKIFALGDTGGFTNGAVALQNYRRNIAQLGEHPTCDILIRSHDVPGMFLTMDRSLEQFSVWLAQSQENLSRYRDNLRKELRNAS